MVFGYCIYYFCDYAFGSSFDNLSNLAENSPRSNARLRAAQKRHPYDGGSVAKRYIERMKGQ